MLRVVRQVKAQRALFSTQPKMHLELDGTPSLQPVGDKPKPVTQMTTLKNGVRVVSEEVYGPAATLGVFVDAGSRYETDATSGTTHLMESMAFKSSQARSHLRLVSIV